MLKSIIFCCLFTSLFSLPNSVVVIRHGEKEDGGRYLSDIGWERAGALIGYFGAIAHISNNPKLNHSSVLSPFNPPYAIYASKPHNGSSYRPWQTATPLANALQLTVQTPFPHSQEKKLAQLILTTSEYDNQEILIVYPHQKIPQLINQLIVQAGGSSLNLAHYPGDRYDLVYVVSYNDKLPTFANLPSRSISAGPSINLTVTPEQLLYQDMSDLPAQPFPLKQSR